MQSAGSFEHTKARIKIPYTYTYAGTQVTPISTATAWCKTLSISKGLTYTCGAAVHRDRATYGIISWLHHAGGLRGVKGSAHICTHFARITQRGDDEERRRDIRNGCTVPLVSNKPTPRGARRASYHKGVLNIPRVYKALNVVALLLLGQPGRAAERHLLRSRGLSPAYPAIPVNFPDRYRQRSHGHRRSHIASGARTKWRFVLFKCTSARTS